jgi:hypothetical protein
MVGAGIEGGFVNTNELHTHTFEDAGDLASGRTANSRTRHIPTRINYLRELRDEHIFTTNVGGKDFERHRDVYVRRHPSTSIQADSSTNSVGEGIGPTRTELIEDRVQGKKRSKSERHKMLLTPKRTGLNSHAKNSQQD